MGINIPFEIVDLEKPKIKSAACRVSPVNFKQLISNHPNKLVTTNTPIADLFDLELDKNVLISLVKSDNMEHFLDGSANIYYTGKKFPSTVALNKLYYFMPYIKGKGIKDLYFVKIARVGTRKEGQPDNDPKDFRLVFEIEYVKELFSDYKPIHLNIWETFTDTTLEKILEN